MAVRILHIDSGRDWRGGQRQVLLLAEGLRDAGFEPLVVGQPGAPLVHRLRGLGLAAAAVPMRSEWDLAAARRIRELIRTWAPDVVHAHDARSHSLALAALVRRRDTPLVVTRRVAFVPRGGRVKYGPLVSRFIAISGAVRDAMVRGGVDPSRIDVVYSGVPAPHVESPRDWRAAYGWPEESVVCGIVGAMTAEKGLALLEGITRALSPAARRLARIVLLGGTSAGRSSIGGVPACRAGFVDDIHDAMAGLDVLLHPSSAEGLGTAVIDAMALGVPPVAFGVGGLPELIEHGRNGLLVPAGDVGAFAGAASQLITNPVLRDTLAAGGPERAARFGVPQMVGGVERVYASLLHARAAR